MKKEIHPEYFEDASVSCICGNSYKTGATQNEIRVEICSKCHPFYTGEQRIVDTEGRVERMRRRYGTK
ncbi:MAG: 50S ribosomal protein L31 [Chloroflexota bacterium]|nr:50S ribosomal protein L31 [Chloroflexota bacterium]MEC9451528.1 50S ribosomal protein L31 [Chloroflexota bacterium]|tara:strand:+ start:520 stop:723 length:204 start_codon:yes stop_codon:yes gene_type:complete